MKKIILAALFLASISSYGFGINAISHNKEIKTQHQLTDVPQAVLDSFNRMFPDAKSVRWQFLESSYHPEHNQYIAFFRLNGKRTARYSPDGTYLGGS